MFEKEYNDELLHLIERYEDMVKGENATVFEQEDFEQIIEFYETTQEFEKALEVVERGIMQFPYSSLMLTKKAQILFDTKLCEQALDVLDQALIYDPSELSIYLLKSDIFNYLGEYHTSIEILKIAQQHADRDNMSDLYLEMADVYEEWGKQQEAYEYVKKSLVADPSNEESINRIWFLVELLENYEDSIKFHERIIDMVPYSYLAWYNLANAYYGLELYEKSIENYKYVIAINEDFEYAYRDCGEAYFRIGNYHAAIEYYQSAIDISKPTEESFFSIGICYEKLGVLNEAKHYYKKSIRIDPNYSQAYYRLGETYKLEYRWKNAVNVLNKAIKIDVNEPEYYYAVGEAHLNLLEYDYAIDAFKKAIKLKDNYLSAWKMLAKSYFDYGMVKEAGDIMHTASTKIFESAELLYLRATYLFASGNTKEAVIVLEDALSIDHDLHHIIFDTLPYLEKNNEIVALIEQYKSNT